MPVTKRTPIIFLLGPSGSGKTTVASSLAKDMTMLPLEIDRWPEGDGIDLEGLRPAWNAFLESGQPSPLAAIIRARTTDSRRKGAVLSFPSGLILSPTLIRVADQVGMRSFVLYGTAAQCLTAFLKRERSTERGLGQEHWVQNNSRSYIEYSREEFTPYRLDAFTNRGHRARGELVDEIARRLAG